MGNYYWLFILVSKYSWQKQHKRQRVKKQRAMLSSFSLVLTRAQMMKWCHPYSRRVFPPQLALFGKPLTDMPTARPTWSRQSFTNRPFLGDSRPCGNLSNEINPHITCLGQKVLKIRNQLVSKTCLELLLIHPRHSSVKGILPSSKFYLVGTFWGNQSTLLKALLLTIIIYKIYIIYLLLISCLCVCLYKFISTTCM